MEKTELRIGNLVGINKNAYHFNGLSNLSHQFKISELRAENVLFNDFFANELYSSLEPIILTGKILLNFGFEKRNEADVVYYEKDNHQNFIICDWGYGLIKSTASFKEKRKKLKYVHQLQNLFFFYEDVEL